MSAANKDKRTKEQLLQILSHTLDQEEKLNEKIKALENELAAGRKINGDHHADVGQYGLSASKESFRIDYYKPSGQGRLKGVIEHLPSRQKKSFKGLGIKLVTQFMERFLPDSVSLEKTPVAGVMSTKQAVAIDNEVDDRTGKQMETLLVRKPGPGLADRLRMQFKNDLENVRTPVPIERAVTVAEQEEIRTQETSKDPVLQRFTRRERILEKMAGPKLLGDKMPNVGSPEVPNLMTKPPSGLLERLRIELQNVNNTPLMGVKK